MATPATTRKALDIIERAASTYVQAFVGLISAANLGVDELADLSIVKTALVGALPAALSVLKSLGAIYVIPGDKSASLLTVGYKQIVKVVVEQPTKKATAKKSAPAKKPTTPKDVA